MSEPYGEDELDALLADGAPVEVESLESKMLEAYRTRYDGQARRAEVDAERERRLQDEIAATNEYLSGAAISEGDDDSRSRGASGDGGARVPGTVATDRDAARQLVQDEIAKSLRRKNAGRAISFG